jgi:hypothetical protein
MLMDVSPLALRPSFGYVIRDRWDGIDSNAWTVIPINTPPTLRILMRTLSIAAEGDWIGSRMRGHIVAPASGYYRFWLASDDSSVLFLSGDYDTVHLSNVAELPSWIAPMDWAAALARGSVSAPVAMTKGQRYAFDARHKQGNGGSHFSLGYTITDTVDGEHLPAQVQVVSGSMLAPW